MINDQDFRNMIALSRGHLDKNAEYVNSLNVFPVPDGDTGTNMSLSLNTGAQAVKDSDSDSSGDLAQVLAKGLLMGARGNSGVILSQLFRGFAQGVKGLKEIDAKSLAKAFQGGVETAYKAVMKPVEGTILTVARESAKAGERRAEESDDVVEVMESVLKMARKSLKKTPDLLPVLKEVGVVDSGGQGLVYVYEGFLAALTGETAEELSEESDAPDLSDMIRAEHHRNVHDHVHTEDIKYGYCTEIMVRIGEGETVEEEFDYDTFRNHLDKSGDSLLVVADDEVIKVHVHTEKPGDVMNYGQRFGSLMKMKVDNMREQHSTLLEADKKEAAKKPKKEYGVIAIAAGEGVQELFRSLDVNVIINGGQTMNPSTEDILNAIKEANAEKVIILPNNKNIFMAADQAAEASETPTVVIPSRTVSQGMTSLLAFNEMNDLETNKKEMTAELSNVVSGQITYSIRDTEIDGVKIKKDDYMGIVDGQIKLADKNRKEAAINTLKLMITEDSEIITILLGEDGSQAEAEEISNSIQELYEDIEIDIHEGKQPVYPYLLSVE